MHENTGLLNSVGQIRTGDRHVLQGTGEAAVDSRVVEEITVGYGEFGARVNRSTNRMTVRHTGSLDDVQGILLLREVETRRRAGDGNAEEVREKAKIYHGELATKERNNIVEKRRR